MFQCYYQSDINDSKTRCKKNQEELWCSIEHKNLWQKDNYVDRRIKGIRQKSIKEIQKGFTRMATEAHLKRFNK